MATTLSQRQYYRKRVKGSMCSKKDAKSCRKIKSCMNTRNGKRKHFCRKRTNTKRKR